MTATRREYVKVAATLRESGASHDTRHGIAGAFAQTNPKFDLDKFLAAATPPFEYLTDDDGTLHVTTKERTTAWWPKRTLCGESTTGLIPGDPTLDTLIVCTACEQEAS